jgi:uncharacterized radical SAM superfamily protein
MIVSGGRRRPPFRGMINRLNKEDKAEKLKRLKSDLAKYEEKLAFKMKFYRGVIHENALSELRHSEVMVLRDMVDDLRKEIYDLEHGERSKENCPPKTNK